MSEKSLDRNGRWRNVVVAFRMSRAESDMLNRMARLSGLTKQDYIIKKLLNHEVLVERSPRTYKALKDIMTGIYEELCRMEKAEDFSIEMMETLRIVADVYDRMQ